jgi:hypothetical protein
MRYYCKHCKSEIVSNYWEDNDCPLCRKDRNYICSIVKIPEYETPEQYKARTGKEWYGAVWCRANFGVHGVTDWFISECGNVEKVLRYFEGSREVLCAQSPNPPPDDWEPEEV